MNHIDIIKILERSKGVHIERITTKYAGSSLMPRPWLTDSVIVPIDNLYIEVSATQTKGTIGKLKHIEIRDFYSIKSEINPLYKAFNIYDLRLMLEADGRNDLIPVRYTHAKLLSGYNGPTKYVRVVKEKAKPKVATLTNKFKQELAVGAWAVGPDNHKRIRVGQITRWTEHNAWASFDGVEFRFDSFRETLILPEDDLLKTLTFAKLSGWAGR